MTWDIYGNKLQHGYCEVHPHVPEEYPCYECRMRDQIQENEKSQRQNIEDEYYAAMRADQIVKYCSEKSKWYRLLLFIERKINYISYFITIGKRKVENKCPF